MGKKPSRGPDATTVPVLGREVSAELVHRILLAHGGDLRVTIQCTRCGQKVECSLGTPDMSLAVHPLASTCPTAN